MQVIKELAGFSKMSAEFSPTNKIRGNKMILKVLSDSIELVFKVRIFN